MTKLPVPKPSSDLVPLRDAVMSAIIDGTLISDEEREKAHRILVDFAPKMLMGVMLSNAEDVQHTLPRLQSGYALASEFACSAESISKIKTNFDCLVTYMDMLHKHRLEREKMVLELVKLSTSKNKEGVDPAKHLHVHLVAPVSTVEFSPQIMGSGESRQKVRAFIDTFLDQSGYGEEIQPEEDLTPEERADLDYSPRLLDPKDLPPEHQV